MKTVTLEVERTSSSQLASGIGASWHSLLSPPLGHGGSAFGGTPPDLPRYQELWATLEEAAIWYRLKFIRAEMCLGQFEPERGKTTPESPEMRILSRILTWAQKHGADVMLQNMWMDRSWNVFPEFAGDPVMETYSAPADLEAFANTWIALLRYLIDKKGFNCIRWICLGNEPGNNWWHLPTTINAGTDGLILQKEHLATASDLMRSALDKNGFGYIRIMGPDEADLGNYTNIASEAWFDHFQDIDLHCYNAILERDVERFAGKWFYPVLDASERMKRYSAACHAHGKGFYLTEFGTMAHGYGFDSSMPSLRESVMKDTALVLEALNSGVDGICKWSFCNRGDLDGRWQMVETWNRDTKRWLAEASLIDTVSESLGQVMRNIPYQAKTYRIAQHGQSDFYAAAVSEPSGEDSRTVFVLNSGKEAVQFSLPCENNLRWRPFVSSSFREGAESPPLTLASESHFLAPPESLTIFTDKST